MSKIAIYNPLTHRNELGGATKLEIYFVKMLTGLAVAACVVVLYAFAFKRTATIAEVAAICLLWIPATKIWYYSRHGWPRVEWDDCVDWVCDTCLHFAWLAVIAPSCGDWPLTVALVANLAWSYPYSCE